MADLITRRRITRGDQPRPNSPPGKLPWKRRRTASAAYRVRKKAVAPGLVAGLNEWNPHEPYAQFQLGFIGSPPSASR